MSREPHASSGSEPPSAEELEHLEELGDDAIVAQQLGAHAPKPRVQVVEEARSIVISDHPPARATPAPAQPEAQAPAEKSKKRRSERTEKTVVIRDRRQIDDLRRHIAKATSSAPPPPAQGILLWVIVGVAAFLLGGVVALFATRDDAPAKLPVPSAQTTATSVRSGAAEPPPVSIDALPIEKK